jgi:hypothetical protein
MKALRAIALVAALGGVIAAAFILPCRKAAATSFTTYVAGDTVSLITKVSQDTAFKSSYDCCVFRAGDNADTTRWINVMGASEVMVRAFACDTCSAMRWSWAGQYVQDTSSTPLNALTVTRMDVDTLGLATGTSQVLLPGNQNGGARMLIFRPVLTSAFDGESHVEDVIHIGWIRFIITQVYTDANYHYAESLRLETYIPRTDFGDAMRTRGPYEPR